MRERDREEVTQMPRDKGGRYRETERQTERALDDGREAESHGVYTDRHLDAADL